MPICQRCGADVKDSSYGWDSGYYGCVPKCGEAELEESTETGASPVEAHGDSASEGGESSVSTSESDSPDGESVEAPAPKGRSGRKQREG